MSEFDDKKQVILPMSEYEGMKNKIKELEEFVEELKPSKGYIEVRYFSHGYVFSSFSYHELDRIFIKEGEENKLEECKTFTMIEDRLATIKKKYKESLDICDEKELKLQTIKTQINYFKRTKFYRYFAHWFMTWIEEI